MGKSSRVNALLVEILLAILFFALAATVILRCFFAAYEQASRADARDQALAGAQNVAAALCASVDPEQALRELGFSEEGGWALEGDGWRLTVSLDAQAAPAGTMQTAEIAATAGDAALFTLPVARYLPGEAAQ